MADIFPFRGLRYNPTLIPDISQVLCPPYDIISPQQQKDLLQKSPYSMVNLEYGEEFPSDNPAENKYSRARATLDEWLNKDILLTENSPTIYLHEHTFKYGENTFSRTALLARVRLEEASIESEKKTVFPHEGTMEAPKLDRIKLLRACEANTSPIFALYENKDEKLQTFISGFKESEPAFQGYGADGHEHKLWAIDKAEVIVKLQEHLFKKALFIADGHHRYETSLKYRQERSAAEKPSNGAASKDQPYDFTFMGLVSINDPGLLILPVHRMLKGINRAMLPELKENLMKYFDMYTFPLQELNPDNYISKLASFIERDTKDLLTICCYGLEGNNYFIFSLKPDADISKFMPEDKSQAYCQLEVSILHHVVLEGMMGLSQNMKKISYTSDGSEALSKVTSGEYQMAFFLRPLSVQSIIKVAQAGDRMPGKSTYFYPKLPTGLVINSLLY